MNALLINHLNLSQNKNNKNKTKKQNAKQPKKNTTNIFYFGFVNLHTCPKATKKLHFEGKKKIFLPLQFGYFPTCSLLQNI